MGRGLSTEQRAVVRAAFDNHRRQGPQRAALAAGTVTPRPGTLPPEQWYPDLFRDQALATLHGWRVARRPDAPQWRQPRRRRPPSATVQVYRDLAALGARAPLDTIKRVEYDVAHASVSRTLARLVARGLLEERGRGRYFLTPAGLALAEALAAEGAPPPAAAPARFAGGVPETPDE